MLLSLSWLREFVPYEGTAQELGDRLTMLGLELEEIVRPYDAIAPIVVGHVVECVDHPESDHLHICKVDAGQGELLDIVCGAPNVAAGQKVPVALVGTTMPGGLVIKKAKLRGAPSFGMIWASPKTTAASWSCPTAPCPAPVWWTPWSWTARCWTSPSPPTAPTVSPCWAWPARPPWPSTCP